MILSTSALLLSVNQYLDVIIILTEITPLVQISVAVRRVAGKALPAGREKRP